MIANCEAQLDHIKRALVALMMMMANSVSQKMHAEVIFKKCNLHWIGKFYTSFVQKQICHHLNDN